MNVHQRRTTAIQMLTAPIVEDHLTVHVEVDIKGMVLIVKVGINVGNSIFFSAGYSLVGQF